MNWLENFRHQNQHLFGEDSDYSDTEPDFDSEENEGIEIEESQETDDFEALKSTLNFTEKTIQKKISKEKFKKISKKKISWKKHFWKKIFFASKNTLKSSQHKKSKKFFLGQIVL